jgi:hypothetical protein
VAEVVAAREACSRNPGRALLRALCRFGNFWSNRRATTIFDFDSQPTVDDLTSHMA